MNKDFVKKNWIYILLLSFIILLNILPHFEEKEEPLAKEKIEESKGQTLFVDFDEAQKRSKKIEDTIKDKPPLYIFYISINLLIVFIFLLGLAVDGFFLFARVKKKNLLQKIHNINPPPWKIGEVFKIIILSLAFSYAFFIVFTFFLGFFESLTGTEFSFYKNENFRMIFNTIILDLAVLFVILRFLHGVHRKRLADMGLVKENIRRNIFYGISGYAGIIPVIFILGILVYILLNILKLKPPPQPIVAIFLAEENVGLIFTASVIAATFGPVIEEIFFRGVMYNAVKRKLGIFWGIFITSVLFSFLHTHAMSYFLVGFIPIAILGALLAYLYEKTGSLIPSITLHVANNIGSVIMVFLFKYFNSLAG